MMSKATINLSHILGQLEGILDSDPYIDELGFILPSQFPSFSKEFRSSPSSVSGESNQLADKLVTEPKQVQSSSSESPFFWHRGHKLGVSTAVRLPLCRAAKDAFFNSFKRYRMLNEIHVQKDDDNDESSVAYPSLDIVETEVMKHSKALLLLSCDFGTAWNSRKLIISSKKHHLQMFIDELMLSKLVLSFSPKSEWAWTHRRWAIKMIAKIHLNLDEVVEGESELVKNIVGNSKMNYRAWNHCIWLVSYMSGSQPVNELQSSRDWARRHVADNSCFHYRARLILQIVENLRQNQNSSASSLVNFERIMKEELDWVASLIRMYVGREALWLHRRFLSLLWMKRLVDVDLSCDSSYGSSNSGEISMFIKDELELFSSCMIRPDNDFGDYDAQATYAATYITWLAKQMPMSFGVELQRSSQCMEIEKLLKSAGRSYLWDSCTASLSGLI